MGLEMGWFPLGNGVCLIIKKAPSDSPIWQLKKRELLLPLSFLITKPIKLDLSNLHYGPHYKPHYRTQGCVIRENNITAPITNPIKDTLVPLRTNFNANGFVRWRTSVYLNLFHWPMGKNSGNRNGVCRYVRAQTRLDQGQLQIWTEHSHTDLWNLKPVEISKNHFNIIWTSLKVV